MHRGTKIFHSIFVYKGLSKYKVSTGQEISRDKILQGQKGFIFIEDICGIIVVISTLFFHSEKGKCTENFLVVSRKDSYKLRPKAATRSDVLYLLGQGNLIFIGEGNVREF